MIPDLWQVSLKNERNNLYRRGSSKEDVWKDCILRSIKRLSTSTKFYSNRKAKKEQRINSWERLLELAYNKLHNQSKRNEASIDYITKEHRKILSWYYNHNLSIETTKKKYISDTDKAWRKTLTKSSSSLIDGYSRSHPWNKFIYKQIVLLRSREKSRQKRTQKYKRSFNGWTDSLKVQKHLLNQSFKRTQDAFRWNYKVRQAYIYLTEQVLQRS